MFDPHSPALYLKRILAQRIYPRLFLLFSLGLIQVACGGGGTGAPAQYPTQVISGTVVHKGAPLANAQVFTMCGDGYGGLRKYSSSTDASGVYTESLDTSVAPCVLQVDLDAQNRMYGYVRALDRNVTAHITPVTDAVLSLTLDTSSVGDVTVVNTISNTEYLKALRPLLDNKVDLAKWGTLSEQLKKTSSAYSDPTNVNAMAGVEPVTAPIQVPSAGAAATPGYFGLLQSMASKGYASLQLQILVKGELFRLVENSNGGEVEDLFNGLVWQRCAVGMTWDGSKCQGTASKLFWTSIESELAKSNALGEKAWRVPTVTELKHVWKYDTTLGAKWFPAFPLNGDSNFYWTSSKATVNPNVNPASVVFMGTTGKYAGRNFTGEHKDQLYLHLVR